MKKTVALECKHFGAGRRLRLSVWRNAEYKWVYWFWVLSGYLLCFISFSFKSFSFYLSVVIHV
jgi:hypothetical protein